MKVIRPQNAVLHTGSAPESLAESTDSPAFPGPAPERMPAFCGRSTFTTDC